MWAGHSGYMQLPLGRVTGHEAWFPSFQARGETLGLAVVYIPRHPDYLRCGGWTELH